MNDLFLKESMGTKTEYLIDEKNLLEVSWHIKEEFTEVFYDVFTYLELSL